MIEYDKIKWHLLEENSALKNYSGPTNIREWVSFVNQYMRLFVFSNNIKYYDPTFPGIKHSDIDVLMLRTLGTSFNHNAISAYRNADITQLDEWFSFGIKWYPIQKTSQFFDRISYCNLRNTEIDSFEDEEIPRHLAGDLNIKGTKINSLTGHPLYIGGSIICCNETIEQAHYINEFCKTDIIIDDY
jgi:hypothetical protein